MKIILFVSIGLIFMYACTPKGKTDSGSATDSVKPETKRTDTAKTETLPAKIPIDTIPILYPNGSKFHFLVYEYYDSLPGKPVKDFELRDATTNDSIFRSLSIKLFFEDEIDHFNGDRDSLFVYPLYSISSKNPLTIDLDFHVKYFGFRWWHLSDITYPFDEESNKILKFLRYTIQLVGNKPILQSALRFVPPKCTLTEDELISQFNKIKREKHFRTYTCDEFTKTSFICYLNGVNQHYKMMDKEISEAVGVPTSPNIYYSYISYIDKFIINLIY